MVHYVDIIICRSACHGWCVWQQKYPRVLFVIGANGMGKTTTIGKIAARLKLEANQTVLVAACDTFRYHYLHYLGTSQGHEGLLSGTGPP